MSHQPLRITALRQAMQTVPVDVVYIRSLSNIAWITGFDKVFDTEQAHAVLVSPEKILIHSDSRYFEALEREAMLAFCSISYEIIASIKHRII